jgi:hypothetical protein
MTNKEFQELLQKHPDDMPIRILIYPEAKSKPEDFDIDNIILTSDTAFVDEEASYDTWDTEDGKIELGDGPQYLLINPIIL